MYEMADFFVGLHKESSVDYTAKYFSSDSGDVNDEAVEVLPDQAEIDVTETPLYQALKQYRYETSKAEGIKAFYVYNNLQLEAVIKAMPRSLDELKKVSGFGDVKCEKYGEGILGSVDRHRK
jgi:superfamily II DNA helicase RecQ